MLFPPQFQKHNYDLQATKNKLLEAANYVDKVRPNSSFYGKTAFIFLKKDAKC